MRANPGGEIDPVDVVGRDDFIVRLRETLDQQSVVLVAERRLGKTSLIKKMRAEAPEGWIPIYRDLEGIKTPLEFAEHIYHDVFKHLSLSKRTTGRLASLFRQLAGIEIDGVGKFPETLAPHWKSLLEKTVEDLVEHQDRAVVFFWDELPLMLENIVRSSGEATAMEVLDTLRGLRQMHGKRLAMVFTGSIGLHHVVTALRDAGHTNDPTNDMRVFEVPPLSSDDAEYLALELLHGEELRCEDETGTARKIAALADCIPFYIHYVVRGLRDAGDTASAEQAEAIVSEALVNDQDPWHLHHYIQRLKGYYGLDRHPVVLAVLDELAAEDGTLTLDALHTRLKTKSYPEESAAAAEILSGNRDALLELIRLLGSDHYLSQHEDGAYGFRFPLIQRWWRLSRGLSC